LVPGLLRLPVHLVDGVAEEPDRDRLVSDRRDDQYRLLPAGRRPEPDHHRLGSRSAGPRLRHRSRARGGRPLTRHDGPAHEDGAHMRTLYVAQGVAWRVLHNVFTNPSLLLPSLIFPLFFFTAFAGGLSSVRHVPGFDFPSGYTAFQFVFVLLQSAAFGGVFTGFGIARDFE